MKKAGVVILALVLLLGLGTVAAYARAKKVDLNVSVWPVMHDPKGDVVGWVIANETAAGEIIIQVHLNKGEPTVFYVFIYNDNWSYDGEGSRHGEFIANNQGKGNWHGTILSHPEGGDPVTSVWVVVRTPSGVTPSFRYATRSISIEEI